MHDSSVADLANDPDRSGWRLPGISPWFWMAVLIGPTSYLYSSGDLVAAIVWGSMTMVGWIGATMGLLRPVAWMISGALATTAAKAFSADLTPKIQEFAGIEAMWAPFISIGILFVASLLVLHWFVWRPLQQYITGHHTLSKINALGGFSLAVGKLSIVLVLGLSGVLYLDDNPDVIRRLNGTPMSGSVDLAGMVSKTAEATRVSRVGPVVDGLVDWSELAEKIDFEKIKQQAANGEGLLANVPGLGAMPSMGAGMMGGDASPAAPLNDPRVKNAGGNNREIEKHLQSIQNLKF